MRLCTYEWRSGPFWKFVSSCSRASTQKRKTEDMAAALITIVMVGAACIIHLYEGLHFRFCKILDLNILMILILLTLTMWINVVDLISTCLDAHAFAGQLDYFSLVGCALKSAYAKKI